MIRAVWVALVVLILGVLWAAYGWPAAFLAALTIVAAGMAALPAEYLDPKDPS